MGGRVSDREEKGKTYLSKRKVISLLTHHTSHITHHTSHITHHTSHIQDKSKHTDTHSPTYLIDSDSVCGWVEFNSLTDSSLGGRGAVIKCSGYGLQVNRAFYAEPVTRSCHVMCKRVGGKGIKEDWGAVERER